MSESCTVLIAAPELLPALKKRASAYEGELLAFPDTEALRALEVISRRRPRLVALERAFAATPRGGALINRIKADPALTGSEIRIVSHDSDESRVVSPAASGHGTAREDQAAGAAVPAPDSTAPAAALDQRGTRRAQRFTMPGGLCGRDRGWKHRDDHRPVDGRGPDRVGHRHETEAEAAVDGR